MRYTPDGDPVTSFSVACDTGKVKPPTWVRVSCWRQLAELANEHLGKGKKGFVRGRVRISDYTDRDGEKRYSLDVTADVLRFLSPSPRGESDVHDGQEDVAGDAGVGGETKAVAESAAP